MTVLLIALYIGIGLLPTQWAEEELERWEWLPSKWRNAILIVMLPIWPAWLLVFVVILFVYILKGLASLWAPKKK